MSNKCLFTKIGQNMESQEAKRQRVSNLLHAQVSMEKIIEITNVSRVTVFNVKKRLSEGDNLKH